MTTMAAAIEQEARARGAGGGPRRDIRPTFGYYRQPDGWITASPATDMDELKYRREGWTPLKAYGYFDMASEWSADHPLEALFMFGGAFELSRDQILQTGMYLNPPLVPSCRQPLTAEHRRHTGGCWVNARTVVFPQMEGVAPELLGPFPCRFCGVDKPTVKARDQHENVTHKEERGDIRTGEALAASLVAGLAPSMTAQNQQQPGVGVGVAELMQELAALRAEVAALKNGGNTASTRK